MFSHKKDTSKKDHSNESPEEQQKRIKTSLLLSAGRLLKSTNNILQSCHALFSGNLFPSDTTDTERAALKESLIVLANRKKEAQAARSLLGAMTSEEKKRIKQQKKNIHQEYHNALSTIDSQIEAQIDPIKSEKKQIAEELKRLKEEYLKKRGELLSRKKELTQQKKTLEKDQKIKHTAAANVKSKALDEIQQQEPEVNATKLTSAEHVLEEMKTDINRVKGNIMAIFASDDQEEKMNAILRGELSAPQKTQAPEPAQHSQQQTNVQNDAERKPVVLAPISSEESIPLPEEQQEKHQIAEGEALLNHQTS